MKGGEGLLAVIVQIEKVFQCVRAPASQRRLGFGGGGFKAGLGGGSCMDDSYCICCHFVWTQH